MQNKNKDNIFMSKQIQLYNRATKYFSIGKYDLAIKYYKQIVKINRKSAEAYCGMGDA
jgi:tetratricopeptide (TPR) repeat protein